MEEGRRVNAKAMGNYARRILKLFFSNGRSPLPLECVVPKFVVSSEKKIGKTLRKFSESHDTQRAVTPTTKPRKRTPTIVPYVQGFLPNGGTDTIGALCHWPEASMMRRVRQRTWRNSNPLRTGMTDINYVNQTSKRGFVVFASQRIRRVRACHQPMKP